MLPFFKKDYTKLALYFFNFFFISILLLIVLFPIYWMVTSSVKMPAELFTRPPVLLLNSFTTQWYEEVLVGTKIPRYFLNSFIVAFSTMLINIIITSLGAYSVTRFKYYGRNIIMLALLASYVVPSIMLLLPLYLMIRYFGLTNHYFGLIIAHIAMTLPLSVWLLRSYFSEIPKGIEEAAIIDGASNFRILRTVILPLTAPGILSTGIIVFIQSWNEYLFSSVILQREVLKTVPVGMATLISPLEIRWGAIMALGTLATVPILVLFSLIQKHFVRGLTSGAVKG